MLRISKVYLDGYDEDRKAIEDVMKDVSYWEMHSSGKEVMGMDAVGRILVKIPNHSTIKVFKYDNELNEAGITA